MMNLIACVQSRIAGSKTLYLYIMHSTRLERV